MGGTAGGGGRGRFVYVPSSTLSVPSSDIHLALLPFSVGTDPSRLSSGSYYSDIIAYGLALDVRKSDAASVAHFSPEVLEDYDLIITGTLNPGGAIEYQLQAPHTHKPFIKQYSVSPFPSMGGSLQEISTFIAQVRETNAEFLSEHESLFEQLSQMNLDNTRRLRFYQALDPEYRTIQARVTAMEAQGQTSSVRFQRITAELARRRKMLDTYRQAELQVIEKRQQVVDAAQNKRMDWFASLGEQHEMVANQENSAQSQASNKAFQQLAGAMLAGVLPAISNARMIGSWNQQNTLTALQDTSSALSTLPQANTNAPPPDYSPYYRQLDQQASSLKQARVNPFTRERQNTIQDMRSKFLRQYQSKITPLNKLL